MENKTGVIIQARLTSSRFPGKILQKLGNQTVIDHLINRIKRCNEINQIILAVPKNKENEKIGNKIKFKKLLFKGSENDVLDRYYKAAKKNKLKNIVRVCGDCPFVDPLIIDKMVKEFKDGNYDYISNTLNPTFPDGLDVEVFSFSTLQKAWLKSKNKIDREHVTRYIIQNKIFKKKNITFKKDLSFLRLTIDEKIDLNLARKIFQNFNKKTFFGIDDIYTLYKSNKKFFNINMKIKRNEGLDLNIGQKLWKRAKNIIPGGNMLLSKRPEMYLPEKWPTYYKKAKGCFVWDLENIKYTDMSLMSVGTNILGYANKKVDNAVINSIKKSNMSSLNCPEEIYLSEKLIDMHRHFDMARYARTGGEANAIAVRIARASSGKDKVAICGYHGWHDWYLSANHNSQDKKGILKDHLLPGLSTFGVPKGLRNTIYPFKFNDFEALKEICANNEIGVIKMEIFRNFKPKSKFLEKVRKLATEKKIVLIFDECTSGFRETFGGLHLKYNVKPDICILGKALGNGFPITVVLGKRDVMEVAQNTFISSTFWTERGGFVAGLKTLEIMEKIKSWNIISGQGEKLKKKLLYISKKHNLKIQISGLSSCPSFSLNYEDWVKYKTFITQELLDKKILGANTTYMSISHTDKVIKRYIEKLDEIFSKISECENDKLNIDSLLKHPLCHTGFKRLN